MVEKHPQESLQFNIFQGIFEQLNLISGLLTKICFDVHILKKKVVLDTKFTEEEKEIIGNGFYKDFADQLSYSNELLKKFILTQDKKNKKDKK